MLARALGAEPEVDLRTFTWRRAILRRYDVFHVHWPEILVRGRTTGRQAVRQFLFAALLARLTAGRTAVVRTVHNLERPNDLTKVQRALLDRLDRLTTLRILINDSTPLPREQASVTILHGHYADWFAAQPRSAREPGRIGFVGLIRPYKGVASLISAFRATTD